MQYRVISTDDHLQETPDTYTSRMSKKWGSKIPQLTVDVAERQQTVGDFGMVLGEFTALNS